MDVDISSSSLTAKDHPLSAKPPEPLKAREARLAEDTLLPELEGKDDRNYVSLAIQDHRHYFQGISLALADPSSTSSAPSAAEVSLLHTVPFTDH